MKKPVPKWDRLNQKPSIYFRTWQPIELTDAQAWREAEMPSPRPPALTPKYGAGCGAPFDKWPDD